MKVFQCINVVLLLVTASALNVGPTSTTTTRNKVTQQLTSMTETSTETTRHQFIQQGATALVGSAFLTLTTTTTTPQPAVARGRATLDQSYERYTPRIVAGGEFYKNDFRALIAKNDWEGIKQALAEPPKRSKADLSKADGGTSERAAQAGGFSDARVLVACDLFAAAFSDNSVSAKTKAMKAEVDVLRGVVGNMLSTAKQALGEESDSGGLFGLGAKKLSKDELSKKMKTLYIEGGNAYNKYVFAANDGLPIQLKKLPYL